MARREFNRRSKMSESDVLSLSISQEEEEDDDDESIHRRRRHQRFAGKRGPRRSQSESDYTSWSSSELMSREDESEEEDSDEYEKEEMPKKHRAKRFTAPSSVVESSTGDSPTSVESPGGKHWTSQQSTYMNVAPLPIFRGDPNECPVSHLSRFARVCRANNAVTTDTMARIFPVTLDGEAGLWYELNVEPREDRIRWEDIVSTFVEAFQRPKFFDQFRSELMSLRQASGESVNAFHLRIQWVLRKWPDHGIPEKIIKGVFIDGLREDYQDWIIPQAPSSLEETLRLASTWEQAQIIKARRRLFSGNQRSPTKTGETTHERTVKTGKSERGLKIEDNWKRMVEKKFASERCEFCDGNHDEKVCEIKKKMREMWRKMQSLDDAEKTIQGDGTAGEKDARDLPGKAACSVEGIHGVVEEKGGGTVIGLERKRSSLCQCWKHQCSKKSERGSLALDRTPSTRSKS